MRQEGRCLWVGFQQSFHPESQRVVRAAGLVQISRPLCRCSLLERGGKDRFDLRWINHGIPPISTGLSLMRQIASEPLT